MITKRYKTRLSNYWIFSALTIATFLSINTSVQADYEGLNYRVTKNIEIEGQIYYSIDLFVEVESSNDRLLMVFGDSNFPLKLSALDGGFYNNALANHLPHALSLNTVFGVAMERDTFVTIGTDDAVLNGPATLQFDTDSFENDDLFSVNDGSWYILPISETLGFPHDELGILIARLTVREDQTIAGTINLTGRLEANGEVIAWPPILGETFIFTSESVSSNQSTPVLPNIWTTGNSNGDRYGFTLANIGDVNGDEFDDLAIGIPRSDIAGTKNGTIEVRSGYDDVLLYTIHGQNLGEQLGFSISGAGDVTGDNIPDFIAGAPYNSEEEDKGGKAYVFSGADGSEVNSFFGRNPGDEFGLSVAGNVTLDGNNVPDAAIGAPKFKENMGAVYCYNLQDGSLIERLKGHNKGDQFGTSVTMTSDSSRFGRLIVGSPKNDDTDKNAGLVDVFQFDGSNFQTLYSIPGKNKNDRLGTVVGRSGDVDNDGIDDFGVGSPYFDSGSKNNRGRCTIYASASGVALWNKNGSHSNEKFPSSISDAGDLNCDGVNDVVFGSANYNASEDKTKAGRFLAVSGNSGSNIQNIASDQGNARFGQAAIGLGNPYGFSKLAIGAWKYSADAQSGRTGGLAYTTYFGCNATADFTEPLADQGRVPGSGPKPYQEHIPTGEVGEWIDLLLHY